MPAVQSAYAETIAQAVAGQIGDMRNFDSITRTAEGNIGFGLAAGRGTDKDKGVLVAGALTDFLGVTIRDITLIHSTADRYEQYDNVGLLTYGDIWVQVSGTPGPTTPVHYNATTGVFASSGGTGPILGARWNSTTVNGLCKLHLPAYDPAGV